LNFIDTVSLLINRGAKMKRVYNKNKNVFDASYERMDFIWANFKRVYLSFSGGKDSGVMLNLAIKYMKENPSKINGRKLGIQIMDNEANYDESLDFMNRIIDENIDFLDVFWCCMPITLPCTVSAYHIDWQCWGERDKSAWIRPMPEKPYIVNIENHPFGELFKEDMQYDEFWDMFAEWYSQGKSCANLIGIRTDESLNRFRAIMNEKKKMIDGKCWTKKNTKNTYNVYPIYDWKTDDVWIACDKFDWDYNTLYDIFYKAGIPIGSMRVASPFMSEAKSSLGLYRVINPHIWARLCARVQGANFTATYGKQLDYKSIKLPEGHTWKSFVKFLLSTLPTESAENFKMRFAQSIRFWARVGRGLNDDVIQKMTDAGIKFNINGVTPHGGNSLKRVRITIPPDHADGMTSDNSSITSWKRFAITILKNDHTCKYMGLQPTHTQAKRQRSIMEKYKTIGEKK
jgi:predicted phosphoadenosine phosphosulfate sulfurtransferase